MIHFKGTCRCCRRPIAVLSLLLFMVLLIVHYMSSYVTMIEALASLQQQQNRRRHKTIPLQLDTERELWQRREPPIETLTWFRQGTKRSGHTDGDDESNNNKSSAAKSIIEFWRERAQQIVEMNPWLAGRVIQGTLDRNNVSLFDLACPVIMYDDDDETFRYDEGRHFVHVMPPDSSIERYTPVETLYEGTREHCAPASGGSCDSDSLWRVTVIPCRQQPERYVALVCTLSHLVGDISVFYKLLGMLCGTDAIAALDMLSMVHLQHQRRQRTSVFQNPLVTNVKGAMGAVERILFRRIGKECWFLVQQEAMEATKQQESNNDTDIPFVSTNDVLTSWFFQATRCTVGLLCVDYRGQLVRQSQNTDKSLLGRNCWDTVAFQGTSISAAQIRKSLSLDSKQPNHAPMNDAPPTRGMISSIADAADFWWRGSICIATSWTRSSGRKDFSFHTIGRNHHCKEELHWPLYDFASYVPANFCTLRTFTPSVGSVGVYVGGDARMVDQLLLPTVPAFLVPIGSCTTETLLVNERDI
jgi:hypothetical protein